jgi:hypothetical protein
VRATRGRVEPVRVAVVTAAIELGIWGRRL